MGTDTGSSSAIISLLWFGYFVWFESNSGATVGKKLLNLRVVVADGSNPSLETAAKRNVWMLFGLVPFVGGLLSLIAVIAIIVTISSNRREPRQARRVRGHRGHALTPVAVPSLPGVEAEVGNRFVARLVDGLVIGLVAVPLLLTGVLPAEDGPGALLVGLAGFVYGAVLDGTGGTPGSGCSA
jgi:uncharacterized RDD family membrane protein YckC